MIACFLFFLLLIGCWLLLILHHLRVGSMSPQWLKKIESTDLYQSSSHDELMSSSHIINVEGEHYRVLESSQVVDEGDGLYVNQLMIEDAKESDAGSYICLGANAMGYRSRNAFLVVMPQGTFLFSFIFFVRSFVSLVNFGRQLLSISFDRQNERNPRKLLHSLTLTVCTFGSPFYLTPVLPPSLVNSAEELFLPMPIIVATIGIFILILVSLAFLLIHCRHQKRNSDSPSMETNSARTVCSGSPKHHPNSKGQPGQAQQQHVLEHPLMSRREYNHQSPHHNYSPVHSNSQPMGPYSPAPSAFTVTPHPSELIPSHHHALLPTSDKTNRSSSVSPAFCAQSVGTRSNVQYHQYYHIPQRTSYGYLC